MGLEVVGLNSPGRPSPLEAGFAHLHARSWYSFLRGASSPRALVERAAALGQPAVAVTDWMTVAGAVKLQRAARDHGLNAIVGAEVLVGEHPLVLIAADDGGYATLCRLLTRAHEDRDDPRLPLDALADDNQGLKLLTGGREGRLRSLLEAGRGDEALAWARALASLVPGRAFVELSTHRRPGERRALEGLQALARAARLPALLTNDARLAVPDDQAVHDLLTCVRLGITVHEPHPERPVNGEAHLKGARELRELVFEPAALANAGALARECRVSLLSGEINPPGAIVPAGLAPQRHLEILCEAGLGRYPPEKRAEARRILDKELGVIGQLDLAEFFLVVHEVVSFARARGIRCAGRGSAANSIVAFLLGITAVDPVEYPLMFERFLHAGRKGTPDIDVDFDSSRRAEVIEWIERRFTREHAAMTANVNTYRIRSAVRDAAKALGWPLEVVDAMTRALPQDGSCHKAGEHRAALEAVVSPSPVLDALLEVVPRLHDCPRHLSLHSGGMLLTRGPLWRHTPVQVSANGVKQAVFDKEDAEAMGLVKLDVLGLRALGAIGTALELHEAATGTPIRREVDDPTMDDPSVFEMVRHGETVGLFQVESPGQIALIARHQPRNFAELVAQIALLRPGPLQGGMVHPYVRRKQGLEEPEYPHPSLEGTLKETFGIILYQEQVLGVAHDFAGLTLEESDEFRRLMSRWRDPGEMAGMRESFVSGALRKHRDLDRATAERVFDRVSKFVGYGFPRSHSIAFGRTVYQTAWLRRHHPAAYFAGVLEHHPGMYPRQSLIEEAKRCGVPVLGPSVARSGVRFTLERHDEPGRHPDGLAIRMPLASVKGVGPADAAALALERVARPYEGVEDLYRRARAGRDVLWALARAGAMDGFGPRREVLWQLGVLERRLGPPGPEALPLLDAPALEPAELARLDPLSPAEAAVWDLRAAGATAGPHPLALARADLSAAGAARIAGVDGPTASVAGLVVARQRPPTAHGIVFLTLEDETGRIQCIVYPAVWERLAGVLKRGAVIVRGRVQRERSWRGLTVEWAAPLSVAGGQVAGGQAGSPHA